MADVNWKKFDCDICLAVLLAAAAFTSAIVVYLFGALGMGVIFQVVLFLIIWAALGWVADGVCAARVYAPAKAAVAATYRETSEDSVNAPVETDVQAKRPSNEANAAQEATTAETKAAETAGEVGSELVGIAKTTEVAPIAEAQAPEVKPERDGDEVVQMVNRVKRPEALDGPRGGAADDLKRIKGIGPKLEKLCHSLGFYHFDQIATWTAEEVTWVDSNLEGFKRRVTRDAWVDQAKLLAAGGETEFSKRVDGGGVPSSQ